MTKFKKLEAAGAWMIDRFNDTIEVNKWPWWLRRAFLCTLPVSVPLWVASVLGQLVAVLIVCVIVIGWFAMRRLWARTDEDVRKLWSRE